jgi:hypothetical protein
VFIHGDELLSAKNIDNMVLAGNLNPEIRNFALGGLRGDPHNIQDSIIEVTDEYKSIKRMSDMEMRAMEVYLKNHGFLKK